MSLAMLWAMGLISNLDASNLFFSTSLPSIRSLTVSTTRSPLVVSTSMLATISAPGTSGSTNVNMPVASRSAFMIHSSFLAFADPSALIVMGSFLIAGDDISIYILASAVDRTKKKEQRTKIKNRIIVFLLFNFFCLLSFVFCLCSFIFVLMSIFINETSLQLPVPQEAVAVDWP